MRLVLLVSCVLAACHDPVTETAIAALGPENSSVAPGPLHRPNQPCVLCHSERGGAPPFAFGGTINRDDLQIATVANVDVMLIDAKGRAQHVTTNCAGNFFLKANGTWPQFPVWATLTVGDYSIDMESPIYRDGSCAACHQDPVGPTAVGHVFLSDDPMAEITLSTAGCEGGNR